MNQSDLSPQDPLKARVLSAIAARSSPTRAEAKRRALALVLTSVALALGVFAWAGGPEHASVRPASVGFALTGGWALAAAALTWIALARGQSTLGRPPALLAAVAIATPALLFAWMHLFVGSYVEPEPVTGWRCLAYTIAMGIAPLGSFLAIRRGADPRAPALLGAAGGAVCGAWSAVLVDLWCPRVATAHALFGHVVPVVALIAVGAIAGRATLATRSM